MSKRTNRWNLILAGVAGGLLSVAAVASAEPSNQVSETNTAAGQTRSQLVHTTATVSKIDHSNRSVTLKMQSGEEMPIEVPAEVKGFDTLKVGSKVDVDYYRSMAVSMAPTGSKPTMNERRGRAVDEGGGIRGREVTISAEVVSVDTAANTVTFKGPKGNLRTVNVQNPALQEKLPSLKPGQVVQFDWVEAVAASIRPAE
jgi:hypothetical protein